MAKHEVGPKISAFCYGYKMVLVAESEKETGDKESGKHAKSESYLQRFEFFVVAGISLTPYA